MLYFRFNKDNFVASQQECTAIEYKDGKPTAIPRNELYIIDFEQAQSFFFKKLRDELSLLEIGICLAYYDVVDIPVDAFSINDEIIGNFDGVLKFALYEYAKLPIKELKNKSLNDLGITIEFCKRASNGEVNSIIESYMGENNFEYVTEEVLWKNMTVNEKVNKFSGNLSKIGSKNVELIIVDPYIFSSEQDEYCEILASVLNSSEAKRIIIVTDKRNYKEESSLKVSAKINIAMDIKYSVDFHDRFWIANREKGFYTGTSFNGIGKKLSLINILTDNDVKDIIDELSNQSLIL